MKIDKFSPTTKKINTGNNKRCKIIAFGFLVCFSETVIHKPGLVGYKECVASGVGNVRM